MWNYRIIKDGETYGLYEVIYNDEGEICAHDEKPTIVGESVDELIKSLEMMLSDINRCKDDILEAGEIKFAPLCDETEGFIEIKNWEDLFNEDTSK